MTISENNLPKKDEPATPSEGGCWFCSTGGCDAFDYEFDTYLHIDCLKKELKKKKKNPEAELMKYLLEE